MAGKLAKRGMRVLALYYGSLGLGITVGDVSLLNRPTIKHHFGNDI